MNAWESRKELLRTMFDEIVKVGDSLPPDEAVIFTHPVGDVLMIMHAKMENRKNENEVNALLNNVLNDDECDATGDAMKY